MDRKRWPSPFSCTVCVLAALAVVWVLVLTVSMRGQSKHTVDRLYDTNSLKVLTRWLMDEGFPLDKTGRVDVYALSRGSFDFEERTARLYFSLRMEQGPSIEQIREGNYAQFPWNRRVGRPTRDAIVPVLWEPKGESRLVSFSDGSVRVLDTAELAAIEPQAQDNAHERGR